MWFNCSGPVFKVYSSSAIKVIGFFISILFKLCLLLLSHALSTLEVEWGVLYK